MAMAIRSAQDLFVYELGCIYADEFKIGQAAQEMSQNCQNQQCKDAFTRHASMTKQQQTRNLEQCFQILAVQPQKVSTRTVDCLVEDYRNGIQQVQSPPLMDLFTLGAAAKTEHFEIAAYTGLVGKARLMGNSQLQSLLERNLADEQAFAQKVEQMGMQLGQQVMGGVGKPGTQPYTGGPSM